MSYRQFTAPISVISICNVNWLVLGVETNRILSGEPYAHSYERRRYFKSVLWVMTVRQESNGCMKLCVELPSSCNAVVPDFDTSTFGIVSQEHFLRHSG